MAADPDYNARAAEFLKLWQDSMTRQMTDPDAIRAMLAAMQTFGAATHDAPPRRPAPAPDAGDAAIRHLTQRVHALEQSVAKLRGELLSVAARAKKPAGANHRGRAKPVAKPKRAVAGKRKPVVSKPKPAAKPRPKSRKK